MFYNCENFFDTVDNAGTEDEDFTPRGKQHYSQKIYEQKLHNIAVVLQSIGGADRNNAPAIIGLAEAENLTVLTALSHQPELERLHYKPIITHGHDIRGINVGMLYDSTRFQPLAVEQLPVVINGDTIRTRDILHVTGRLFNDTLDIFVNHWPSRRHDDTGHTNRRLFIAKMLHDKISEIIKNAPHTKIIVGGDFNDNPTDSSIVTLCGNEMYNPFTELYKKGQGTECYKDEWNLLDQILLSNNFRTQIPGALSLSDASIYKPAFLTDHRKGMQYAPFRSWQGTYWAGGYSDHYPVVVTLIKNN